jgi:hypothetical protein
MSPEASEAPPLGQRPTEPTPGKASLEDPRGAAADESSKADGNGGGAGTCPDCGLPFGEHPEYHLHDGSGGKPGWAEVDLGDADMDADDLPGQRIDGELGGDPAEA